MSTNIKTWQVRRLGIGAFGNDSVFMQAEIAELRAALSAAQAKITELEVAGCTDSYALQSAIATQAPSAPVAPPVTEKMATFYLSTSGEYCTHQVGDCKVPVWLKDHSKAEAFMLIMDSLLSRASAALSVQAEPITIDAVMNLIVRAEHSAFRKEPVYLIDRADVLKLLAAPTPPTTGEA